MEGYIFFLGGKRSHAQTFLLVLHSEISPAGTWDTILETRNRNWIGYMQSKHPNYCTIAPIPRYGEPLKSMLIWLSNEVANLYSGIIVSYRKWNFAYNSKRNSRDWLNQISHKDKSVDIDSISLPEEKHKNKMEGCETKQNITAGEIISIWDRGW